MRSWQFENSGKEQEKVRRVEYVSIKSTRGEQSRYTLWYVRTAIEIFQNSSGSVEDEKIPT